MWCHNQWAFIMNEKYLHVLAYNLVLHKNEEVIQLGSLISFIYMNKQVCRFFCNNSEKLSLPFQFVIIRIEKFSLGWTQDLKIGKITRLIPPDILSFYELWTELLITDTCIMSVFRLWPNFVFFFWLKKGVRSKSFFSLSIVSFSRN